jgi:hypothetical protein
MSLLNWNPVHGTIIAHAWQQSFYPNLDAFLAMARSIPEIIHCCFGHDTVMKDWFESLALTEQTRRNTFSREFNAAYFLFRNHAFSIARNISFHREGYALVEVAIMGHFGTLHYTAREVPENPAAAKPVADIFSLGVILQELGHFDDARVRRAVGEVEVERRPALDLPADRAGGACDWSN